MELTAHEATRQMLDIIREVKAAYEQAEKVERDLTDECNDLNHALELLPLSREERRAIGEQLGEVRWRRRKAKEDMEQLEPLVSFLKKQRALVADLNQVLHEINATIQTQAKRCYMTRIRKDLGEVFEHRARDREVKEPAATVKKLRMIRSGIN